MKQEDFMLVVVEQFKDTVKLLNTKKDEYVFSDDRLSAFKLDWMKRYEKQLIPEMGYVPCYVNPKEVLWGQMVKHLTSLHDMCKQNDGEFDVKNIDKWHEKITDTINYLCLLRAIVEEIVKNESKIK